ncbi:hypothetical protein [Leptospira haakeii]|uniref:Uncharacterized protein n=1 Tax=Leptospira haakeii TaxID=2023198 RepID=A0ABX4PST2_9LEPT|nr:hypothetical protein [Leptospira haakeii]PKA17134.1 hypothetical protein CH363_00285 [Leptospira haakeii]PKA20858.1 hypothetical protein CH377_00285 [Leptospira haakeii]
MFARAYVGLLVFCFSFAISANGTVTSFAETKHSKQSFHLELSQSALSNLIVLEKESERIETEAASTYWKSLGLLSHSESILSFLDSEAPLHISAFDSNLYTIRLII